MHTTLFMAMSVNGVIATPDGQEEFLSDENWRTFSSLAREFSNFIVGRRTYEAVKNWGEGYGFDDFPEAHKVVVSDDPAYKLDPGYVLVGSPQEALGSLEKAGFERALLAGGSTTNSSFAKAGLVDEIILNVEPVVVGKGISVFGSEDFQMPLELLETKKIEPGILQLHYQVGNLNR